MIDLYYWPTPNGKKVTILDCASSCSRAYGSGAGIKYEALIQRFVDDSAARPCIILG
jgi:hypothetical protein